VKALARVLRRLRREADFLAMHIKTAFEHSRADG
jgi:hypothetical protein